METIYTHIWTNDFLSLYKNEEINLKVIKDYENDIEIEINFPCTNYIEQTLFYNIEYIKHQYEIYSENTYLSLEELIEDVKNLYNNFKVNKKYLIKND